MLENKELRPSPSEEFPSTQEFRPLPKVLRRQPTRYAQRDRIECLQIVIIRRPWQRQETAEQNQHLHSVLVQCQLALTMAQSRKSRRAL